MACFRLERFCCCCNLRTGSLVIATIGWVLSLCQIFGLSFGAITFSSKNYNDEYEVDMYRVGYRIGTSLVSLIIAVMLIYGILKKKAYFFMPWLIVTCLASIILTIGSFAFFVFIFTTPETAQAISFCLVFGLLSVLYWYFWACVYSHYWEVKEVKNNTGKVYYSASEPLADGQCAPPAYTEKDRGQMA